MRAAWLVIGFIGAGLVGAVGGRILFPEASPPVVSSAEPDRLEARVGHLEAEVSRLTERIPLEALAGPLPALPIPSADVPVHAAGGAAVATFGETPPGPLAAGGEFGAVPVFEDLIEEKVREVVEERVQAARAEQARQAAANQAKKEAEWLAKVKAKLDLTDPQMEGLTNLLARRREFVAEYKRKLAARGPDITPGEREALQQEARDYSQRQDWEIRGILSSKQYEELMVIIRGGKGNHPNRRGR